MATKKEAAEKAAWLKKTRKSPAAKSGAFSDDERWKQQQRHRAWKESRKKGNKNKGNVSNEKDTGPTKLIKGVDGKVRRIKTKNQRSSTDTRPPKKKDKIKVSNEKNTSVFTCLAISNLA